MTRLTRLLRSHRDHPVDPRLIDAVIVLRDLVAELEPGDVITGVSVDVVSADGQVVSYSLAGGGGGEVLRLVTDFSDPAALAAAYEAASVVVADATVRGMP